MNYKKFILSLILLSSITVSLYSQNNLANKDSLLVLNTINKLFDGMREGDSAKVHSVFHENVRMFTSYKSKTGENVLEEGKLNGFLNAVGSPHQENWDEKISNTSIKVDGRLAQVWTDDWHKSGQIILFMWMRILVIVE
jgi:hypothetical protein